MNIKIREIGDVSVVELHGSLDTGTSTTTEAILFKLLDSGKNKLLLNVSSTTYISSAGLRIVLATAKRVKGMGGRICLCQPQPTVAEVLSITGFSQVLEIFDTEEEALKGF
jgi:anti-sigma B factor antagonist